MYVKNNSEILIKKKGTQEFRPMTQKENEINTAHKDTCGWTEIEGDNLEGVLIIYYESANKERNTRKIETKKREETSILEYEKLLKLNVIPATKENLRIVLTGLNRTNWGGWKLPKMSITYFANQYDCDGVQATTIKLDEPVDGHKKYKVGGKMGHLNSYMRL